MSDIDLGEAQASTLAGEYEAIYAYGLVGAHLTGAAQARALKALQAHIVARDGLRVAITAAGAAPVPSDQAYLPPSPVTDPASAAKLAATVEQSLVRTYSALAAATPTGEARTAAARTAQECAVRAITWGAKTSAFPA